MRSRTVVIISIIFFTLVNTSYFIEKLSGIWDILIAIVTTLGFLVLGIILIGQLFKLFKEKLGDKSRIISTIVLIITLTVTGIFPLGVINYEDLQGEDLLVASLEGGANCQTVLKIKKNNKFIQTSLCFGVDKWSGTHQIFGDTVKLNYVDTADLNKKFAYGLIKLTKNKEYIKIGRILMFQSYKDTMGLPMNIDYYDK